MIRNADTNAVLVDETTAETSNMIPEGSLAEGVVYRIDVTAIPINGAEADGRTAAKYFALEPAPEPKPEPTEVPEPEPTEVPEPEPTEVPGPGPRTEPTPDIWAVPLDASADPLQIEQLQLVLERWGWLTLAGGEFSAQRGVLDQVTLQAVLDFQLFVNEQYAGVSGRPLVLLDLALENPAIQPDTLKLIMNDQMVEIFKP
ncbi:MAG: hypothetical protein BWY81_00510 [Firmicutes bacterium ADurb.Bin467]|nr:MAG: hypothetical protein BWY81_00510 [Firmicutes bacterium ADurb.Bin467]